MIKTYQGETEVHGSAHELMADLTIIVHTLCYDLLMEGCDMTHDEAREAIMDVVERGLRTGEEIERECTERVSDALAGEYFEKDW